LRNLKGTDQLKELGVDGKIKLEWIFKEIGWICVYWMHLVHVRDQWQAPEKGLCSMKLVS
jgi:hypothetical protein